MLLLPRADELINNVCPYLSIEVSLTVEEDMRGAIPFRVRAKADGKSIGTSASSFSSNFTERIKYEAMSSPVTDTNGI